MNVCSADGLKLWHLWTYHGVCANAGVLNSTIPAQWETPLLSVSLLSSPFARLRLSQNSIVFWGCSSLIFSPSPVKRVRPTYWSDDLPTCSCSSSTYSAQAFPPISLFLHIYFFHCSRCKHLLGSSVLHMFEHIIVLGVSAFLLSECPLMASFASLDPALHQIQYLGLSG